MRRFYLVILVLVVLVGLGVVVSFSGMRVNVVGNISQHDVVEIKDAVHHATTDRVLGPPGKRNFLHVIALVKYSYSHPIVRIEVQSNGEVEALLKKTTLRGDVGYLLKKEKEGWKVEAELFD